jgi:hypothetical protein
MLEVACTGSGRSPVPLAVGLASDDSLGSLEPGGRRVSKRRGRRWEFMLDLLYLLSLMGLRAEDFIRYSE